jgi:hypothetical protein
VSGVVQGPGPVQGSVNIVGYSTAAARSRCSARTQSSVSYGTHTRRQASVVGQQLQRLRRLTHTHTHFLCVPFFCTRRSPFRRLVSFGRWTTTHPPTHIHRRAAAPFDPAPIVPTHSSFPKPPKPDINGGGLWRAGWAAAALRGAGRNLFLSHSARGGSGCYRFTGGGEEAAAAV